MTSPIEYPVAGDLDALAIKSLRPDFTRLGETAEADVVIDLSRVDFVDSSGVGALVFLYKRLAERERSLTLRGVHGQPRDLFAFLGMDKTIVMETSGELA